MEISLFFNFFFFFFFLDFEVICSKRLIRASSTEMKVQVGILFKEGNFQRQITKKLKISAYQVQYALKRHVETGANLD